MRFPPVRCQWVDKQGHETYPGKVVCSILLAGDQLLRVKQLAIGASADLINHSGLQNGAEGKRQLQR